MREFSSWTLEMIRQIPSMGWMEEKRFDWLPLTANAIKKVVDTQSMIIITDTHRDWYGRYLLKSLNPSNFDRPLLPIFDLNSLFPHIQDIDSSQKFDLLDGMLELFLPNGYFFFYIGSAKSDMAKLLEQKGSSLLWLYDKKLQNSFYLGLEDERSDLRLMQLAMLLKKSIEAVLFDEVDLQGAL